MPLGSTGQKFIHQVDDELADDAQYRHITDIPASALNLGTTVILNPGVYEFNSNTGINFDNITFKGVGAKADVVLANLVLGSTCANTIVFENLTLSGNSPAAGSTSRSLFITNGSSATVKLYDVTLKNADFGVDNQSTGLVQLWRVEAHGVDRAVRSNAAFTEAFFSYLSVSSNAWFTGANATLKAANITATFAGAANTGNTSKTTKTLL